MRRWLKPLVPLLLVPALATAALYAQRPRAPHPAAKPAKAQPAPTARTPAPAPSPAAAPADAPQPGALSPRNASYQIEARLDAGTKLITGREWITWRNITSSSTSELLFHLYYNGFRNSASTWLRERSMAGRLSRPLSSLGKRDWGWIDVTAMRVVGVNGAPPIELEDRTFASPDDGNPDDRTVLVATLPRPVAPGETLNVYVEWTSQVPRTFSRTGAIGDYFFVAQWFPKLGVLEENGWNCHQFHAGTEFYSDYGIYDVKLTVPKGWVVGATGLEREARENGDGTSTHRFYQEDVHDFAWTTSPDYLVKTAAFNQPGLPRVEMRLLLLPEHAGQADRYFDATRAALRYYGQWFGPYPYPHITVVDPAWQSGAGGMEYPTLFTGGTRWLAPKEVADPEGVTVHECGHQFWYAIVGNNEFEHAWLDEGFNTFSTGRTMALAFNPNYNSFRVFGGFVPWVLRDFRVTREVDENGLADIRDGRRLDVPSTPSWRYWPGTGGSISYSKTALWLNTLERHLGWSTLQRIMSTFFHRWQFRHPKPEDFFAIVNEVSGRDMTWYFDEVYRSSKSFDYAVDVLNSGPVSASGFFEAAGGKPSYVADRTAAGRFRTTVVVRRLQEGVFPVDVLVTFKNGEKVRERWDGRDRWKRFTYERNVEAVSAQVDPERVLLLDVNSTNNSRTLEPAGPAAATKWTLKWMVWLQDLLLNAAFLV